MKTIRVSDPGRFRAGGSWPRATRPLFCTLSVVLMMQLLSKTRSSADFGEDENTRQRRWVAVALLKEASSLERGREEAAIAAYSEIWQRYSDDDDRDISRYVSTALIKKGVALDGLGREEALGNYDHVIQRVGDTDDPELLELLAMAMNNKSAALHKLERTEELLGVFARDRCSPGRC